MNAKHVVVAGIMACSLSSTPSAAQVFVGDSLRAWDGKWPPTWNYGQLIAQEPGRLLLLRGGDSVYVALARLQRLERWQRHDKWKVMGTAVAAGVLTATLAYFVMPEDVRTTDEGGCVISGTSSVCTTRTRTTRSRPMSLTQAQLLGGAVGAVGGFIGLSITPGRWRVVLNR